jgi:hypothetical protein
VVGDGDGRRSTVMRCDGGRAGTVSRGWLTGPNCFPTSTAILELPAGEDRKRHCGWEEAAMKEFRISHGN